MRKRKYLLLKGSHSEGKTIFHAGDVIESTRNLSVLFQNKFRVVGQPAASANVLPSAPQWARTKRVGIWMTTSTEYSGGRIHLYQYAWSMAYHNSVEVWLVTQQAPRWAENYPACGRLHIAIWERDPLPIDFDLIVTDNKGKFVEPAVKYRRMHCPRAKYACMNFETPNWVAATGLPELAGIMHHNRTRELVQKADFYMSCSEPGNRYLREWLGQPAARCYAQRPAINEHQLAWSDERPHDRPYAVYCARLQSESKKVGHAVEAVLAVDGVLDLAIIGAGRGWSPYTAQSTRDHAIFAIDRPNDRTKYTWMHHARMVLAPSLLEGYGMVPGEALACETPCIAYESEAERWGYGDKVIQWVPWNDRQAFTEAVTTAATKPKPSMRSQSVAIRVLHTLKAQAEHTDRVLPYHTMKRKSVTVNLIAYWGETVQECLASVYEHVDQIVVAYGVIDLLRHIPPDQCYNLIQSFPDPDSKIEVIERDVWQDKDEMMRALGAATEGTYCLLMGTDEIWHGLGAWLSADVGFGSPRWVHFWHTAEWWIWGGARNRWGKRLEPWGCAGPHYRWSWWRPSYKWKNHSWPVDCDGRALTDFGKNVETAERVPETVIYHLGHMLPPDFMHMKHEFYRRRDRSDKQQMWDSFAGVPGPCGDGIVEEVTWQLPQLVRQAVTRIQDQQTRGSGIGLAVK